MILDPLFPYYGSCHSMAKLYRRGWRRAARRVWEQRAGTRQTDGREWFGSACFGSWEGFWEWWLLGRPLTDPNQLLMFGAP